MIQEEACSVESMICTDFDILFRLIKAHEDSYLSLNQVVSKVLHGRSQIEENVFIHDVINKYKQLILSHKDKQKRYQQQQLELLRKHPQRVMANERVDNFLKRACFRVIQVIFATVNQGSHKAANLYQKFLRLKVNCQKIISESKDDKSYQLIRHISQFSQSKYSALINCLQSITDSLENGRISQIDKIKDMWLNSNQTQVTKADYGSKQNSIKEGIRCRQKLLQKKQHAKEQAKIFDRVFTHKKARKVMDCYKDVMDFNRQDFLEDFIGCCHQNKDKAVKELIHRNQKNKKLITEFIEKKPHKRKRKLSETHVPKEEKRQLFQDKINLVSSNQASSDNTKKSLLLKFKNNQYRERTLTTEFCKKISKGEFRLRNNYRKGMVNTHYSDREQQNAIIKAIEDIICQNQELEVKVANEVKTEEKLPFLNKRACSVDKQYQQTESELSKVSISKNISTSVKHGSSRVKNGKLQKSQAFNSKLKSSGSIVYQSLSHKLVHINDLNKQVLF